MLTVTISLFVCLALFGCYYAVKVDRLHTDIKKLRTDLEELKYEHFLLKQNGINRHNLRYEYGLRGLSPEEIKLNLLKAEARVLGYIVEKNNEQF